MASDDVVLQESEVPLSSFFSDIEVDVVSLRAGSPSPFRISFRIKLRSESPKLPRAGKSAFRILTYAVISLLKNTILVGDLPLPIIELHDSINFLS